MERFKAAEKEMKTKAFSKEGLIAAARLGPTEKAKAETSQWLTSMVDELSRQTEGAEAEIEQALATTKKAKKGSSKDDRASVLEHQIERRNWHISRLEILLRMLENGTLDSQSINTIKEDIAYFVESNTEDDFEEDEGIYDEFNLDEEKETFGLKEDDGPESSPPTPSVAEEPAPPAPAPAPKAAPKEAKKEEKKEEKKEDKKEEKKEEPKKAAKKAASSASPANGAALSEPPLKERVVTNFEQGKLQSSSPSVPNATPKPATPAAVLPPIRYAAAAAAAVASSSPAPPSRANSALASTDAELSSPAEAPAPSAASGATPTSSAPRVLSDTRLPDTLSDLVSSFEWAKQKPLARDSNAAQAQHALEASFAAGVPEPMDSDWPRRYVPDEPCATPHYYPQTPAAIFDNPALYSKFDVDTLFYIFYYQQGTYHQYLAARELKKQSWRFHKQYLTWFQRHSEPQAITDEYEQGAYVYFDWEGSWCQRRKNDFRFEYRWLEDN